MNRWALLALVAVLGAGAPTPVATAAPPVLDVVTADIPKAPTVAARVITATIAPGESTFWHTHPTPPFVYVESGSATWEYRGRPSVLRHAGQAIMEPANVVMRITNHGTVPVKLVLFQVSRIGEERIHRLP
jgi:quercetin dioxygenase-like cupin family protein